MAEHSSDEFARLWSDWQRDLPRRQSVLVGKIMGAFVKSIDAHGRAPAYWTEVLLDMARAAMPPLVEVEVHAVPSDIFTEEAARG